MTRLDYRFSGPAQREVVQILRASTVRFGAPAALRYQLLIGQAVSDLTENPTRAGVRQVDGRLHYHLRHSRSRVAGDKVRYPRHVLVCRIERSMLVIMAVGHDAMEDGMVRRIEEGDGR
ncbi:type II toxin-antitoxin system RelE/ParE family toxin [Acidisoma silvae]|uniref:Type II toxin-antitoxin system RelE/ParE family toxin n=1 Tax=Acidisoma silvae TaxID=2802396 RepID=A0A963YWL5_9PROT|nr:type II toxin-antitoxin system RelE/ParE family toxin [Acidisoma silvae]